MHFLFVRLELVAVLAATAISVASSALDEPLLTLGSAALFGGVIVVLVFRRAFGSEGAWYEARAVAESAKSLAWRYAMRAPPFVEEGDEAADTRLLAVIFREVGDTADRRVAAEGGVTAVMIVAVQPERKGGGTSRLAAVDADIGPLLEEGTVEALDLAVGLGVVGPCAATAHAGGEARARERGAAISGAVVGEHGAHGDAALGEPGASPLPEGDRGDRALVGEDLAVGEAGVVVDHGVDVSVANAAVAVMAVATAAVDAPAAAWGDAGPAS